MVFNALPLLLLAVLYLAVGGALTPAFLRERPRLRQVGYASALLLPCLGLAAGLVALRLLVSRQPLAGHLWLSLVAIGAAAIPLVALLLNWRHRELFLGGGAPARTEPPPTLRDRELRAVERLSHRLAEAAEPREIGEVVADEGLELFGVDVVELVVVDDDARTGRVVAARGRDGDVGSLLDEWIDLELEQGALAAVVAQPAPFAVFDVEASLGTSRLAEHAGAKSAAFLPVFGGDGLVAVLALSSRTPRVFGDEELSLMQAFASEAGTALGRAAVAAALADALERERVVARISREVRSRLELEELVRVACAESARAIGCSRCVIRLARVGRAEDVVVEWDAEGIPPLGADAPRRPVSALAPRDAGTVACGDVLAAPELRDPILGDVDALVAAGTRAVLATPVVGFDEVVGTLAFHRADVTVWAPSEVLLAEAVAREVATAVHVARARRESERRLAEQAALLRAARTSGAEPRFDAVVGQLCEELRALLGADAVECWTLLRTGRELECRAAVGATAAAVGRRAPVAEDAAALAAEGAVVRAAGADGFAEVLEAPLRAAGEAHGVLRAYARVEGRFDADAGRIVEGLASLATLALRNAETFEQSARQAQVDQGFSRIEGVLSAPLSAEATLDAVAQAAADALGGDAAGVLRATGTSLELAGAHELPEGLASFFLGGGARDLSAAAAAGKMLASRSVADDTRFGTVLPQAVAAAGLRSLLAVPLQQPRNDAHGLVLVFFADEHVFTDEQLALAGHVARVARSALERSDLYELERRSRALAQRLAAASRQLSTELDPGLVLERAALHAAGVVDAPAAAVWVLEGDELVVHAAEGEGAVAAVGTRLPSTAWLLGDIVQSRRTTTFGDVSEDPRAAEADPLLGAGYVAYVGVPLLAPDGGVHGIVSVYDRRPREWRVEETEALVALASSAATAHANALQYQEVREEQQRSEAILANVADGIVAVDRDGEVVLWNPAAEQITGVSRADAIGRTPVQVLGRSLEERDVSSGRSRVVTIRRGSDDVALSLTEAVMTDPAGAVAGRIYAFRDISTELAVEHMKSGFVSTVSHELRTPLTSIYGFAETLLRQDVLFGEAERETFLRYISSESERLTAIVDRLLAVAQVDAGAMAVQVGTTDVGRVVETAVASAKDALGTNGHRFVVDVEGPALAAEADAEKLQQVLSHLLENAVRYSPAGGRVTVDARRVDGDVEVRVVDEGMGIPHAERERIFRKFYRGESAARTTGAGAAGLGLFLAQGLVAAMGGKIWVDSADGQGSTFVVALPAAGE